MLGAILGDIIGSPFELAENNIRDKNFPLFCEKSKYTDDSVMTLAVSDALLSLKDKSDMESLKENVICSMRLWGRKYPDAGYGARFKDWLFSENPRPYGSFGNGSAMRVSPVSYVYDSLEEVQKAAAATAIVTHSHGDGIKGAQMSASAVFLARTTKDKAKIRKYMEGHFACDFGLSCGDIRALKVRDYGCVNTVKEALTAFFESNSFEAAVRSAVSLGGDSDTIAAIAGSVAEAYYGISDRLKNEAFSRLPHDLEGIARRFDIKYGVFPQHETSRVHEAIIFAESVHRGQRRKGSESAYIVHPLEVFQILTTMSANDDLLIAGLLHDAIEDASVSLCEISRRFGERAAYLVSCHTEDKSKAWRERKENTVKELYTAERDVRLLIMADKVANLRSMLYDFTLIGDILWQRFNAGKDCQAKLSFDFLTALRNMENDKYARHVYDEMKSLICELFVEFYRGEDEALYALPYSLGVYRLSENKWVKSKNSLHEVRGFERLPHSLIKRLIELA